MLAKHDENYMPKEVADALKKTGHWKDDYAQRAALPTGRSRQSDRRTRPLRAGAGARAWRSSRACRSSARAATIRVLMAWPRPPRSRSSSSSRVAFGALAVCYVTSDFSVLNVYENSPFGEAADLQDHQRLGQPRRLDAAVGADPRLVRRAGRGVRQQSAGGAQGQRARGAGLDRGRLSSVHPGHLEPVPAHRRRAVRGPRSQSDPAGPRPRHPSAAALSRLCRLLDLVLVRHRGADRRPHRRRLGALGAAVGARRLDVPDARHRHGLVLGLLRARLGRLLVLGPGRERLADAVARRHRAAAFRAW